MYIVTKYYCMDGFQGPRVIEPDTDEFISALAAGNNAQLMVAASASFAAAFSKTLALVSAARQTGGRVISILPDHNVVHSLIKALGHENATHVHFVVGDGQTVIVNEYREVADFVLIDCDLKSHERIVRALRCGRNPNGLTVVGFNAFGDGSWRSGGSRTSQLLPIGDGLLVTKITATAVTLDDGECNAGKRRSQWVVRVDKCTGEEHVFRVRTPKVVQV